MPRPRTEIGTHGAVKLDRVGDAWRARTRYRGEDGRLRQVERFGPTDKKAEKALKVAVAALQRHGAGGSMKASMKVKTLGQRFLEAKEGRTTPATLAAYRRTVEKNIAPDKGGIGELTIAEVTTERVDAFLKSIERAHGPASAKSCRSVLSGMLALAVRNGALKANPVREVERIRQPNRQGAAALSRAELEFLLAAVRTDARLAELDLVDVIEFMAATGCRVGEAIALEWGDVDLDAGTVRLDATVVRVTGQGLVRQGHGKTAASGRTIVMASPLRELLSDRRGRAIGDLVFPTMLGNLRDPQNTERDWRDARKRLGLGDVKLHAFRKTVATMLDGAGLSARDVAEYLGHANPSMTQDRYMSKTAGTTRAAAVLSDVLAPH